MEEFDLPMVMQIEERAYDYPWTLSGFEKSLDQGLNYVFCKEDAQILGYCCILPVLDEAHLLNICISPDYQRQGLAKQAMLKLFTLLKESQFNIVFLEVRVSNIAALNLYKQLGFTEDGVRKDYYRSQAWCEERNQLIDSKEDAVLMSFRM